MAAVDAPTRDRALALVPVAVSALTYVRILGNYFVQDDFFNFYNLVDRSLAWFLMYPHGGHSLVVRNFIWWVLYQVFGVHPQAYFASMLITHLVVVWLLFEIIRRVTGSARAACLSATLWGSAPVQQGSLGFYAVYGYVFATALVAWLLYRLASFEKSSTFSPLAALRWALILLAVVTSFGVGIGMAIAMPVVAFLLLPRSPLRRRVVATTSVMAVICPLLYWSLIHLYTRLYGLTLELAVVLTGPSHPISVLADFTSRLAAFGIIDLLAGVLAPRIDFPSVAGNVLVAGYLLVLLIVFVRSPARTRRILLAALVLCLACYGPTALGRVMFFQKGVRYETMPRFQYAGTLALAIMTGVALARLGDVGGTSRRRDAGVLGLAGIVLLGSLVFGPPIDHHAFAREEVRRVVDTIRAAAAATPAGAEVYIANQKFFSVGPVMSQRRDLFPGWAAVYVIFFPDDAIDGRPIRFVSDANVVAAIRGRRRTPGLIVTDEQRPR